MLACLQQERKVYAPALHHDGGSILEQAPKVDRFQHLMPRTEERGVGGLGERRERGGGGGAGGSGRAGGWEGGREGRREEKRGNGKRVEAGSVRAREREGEGEG